MNSPVRFFKWKRIQSRLSAPVLPAALATLGLLSACGSANSSPTYSLLPTSNNFTQSSSTFTNKLDILWVVDNSSSMSPLQTNLTANFSSFISNFAQKNYDFKIAVTATDAYLSDPNLLGYSSANHNLSIFHNGTDSSSHATPFVLTPITPNLSNVFVINAATGQNGSGDERAFSSIRTSLANSSNAGFLRPDSFFAIIIVSDEDDFSSQNRVEGSWQYPTGSSFYVADHSYSYSGLDTVSSYETYLDQLTNSAGSTRRYNVSSIAVLDSNCLSNHVGSSPSSIIGQRYIQLSQDTNGTTGSICDASYANALNSIQSKIAELSTAFRLNRTPVVSSITVLVNGQNIPQNPSNGWTYDSSSNSILFHGSAIPPQNANISINFDPTTIAT